MTISVEYPYAGAGPTCSKDSVLPAVISLLKRLARRRVLDIGCGNGELCRIVSGLGYQVVGCDPSESGIRIATESIPSVKFKCLGIYDAPSKLEEEPFDIVVATEVIEHLFLPRYLPRFARELLKPDGYLILSTPYHGYLKNLAISLVDQWDAHWGPSWDGGHVKFWSPSTLKALVESEGYYFESFLGVGRVRWLWKSMILVFRPAAPRTTTP